MTKEEVMREIHNIQMFNYTLAPDEVFLLLKAAIELAPDDLFDGEGDYK